MQEVDGITPMDISAKKKAIKDECEGILEWNYLTPIYGNYSRLSYDEWKKKSNKKKYISKVWYQP